MANELTVTANLTINRIGDSTPSLAAQNFSTSGVRYVKDRITVTITEIAIPLGSLSGAVLGMAIFVNLDPTNFVEIRTGTGGTKIIRLKPGWPALFYFGSGVTAPYIIADTASCDVEFKICEA